MNPEFKRKAQAAEEPQEKQNTTPTRRQIAPTARALFDINDVQWTAVRMHDLHNIELVNNNFEKFDQGWVETLMALEKETEADLLEGLPTESCRSRPSCNMPWRNMIPIKFTAKSPSAMRD